MQEYSVLIIPGGGYISADALKRIGEFYENGGKVIALASLPSHAAEFGRDAEVQSLIASVFGTPTPIAEATATNDRGGKFIRESSAAEDVALYPKQAVTLLKLGEAYLIAAEAAITAVSPSEGLSILRQLQDARKGGIYDTTDGLKEEILLEYRRETLGEGQLFYAYKRRNEPRLTTLFQTPDMAYYFTMDDNKYTPDIPDKEYNAGRTY